MRAGSPPHPPFGVEPVGEGGLVERDPLLLGQGDLPARLVRDHPSVHGRLAQHRGLRGPGGGQSSRTLPSQRGLSLAPAPRQQQDGGGRHQPRVGDSGVSPRGRGRLCTYVPVALVGIAPDVPLDVLAAGRAVHAATWGGQGCHPPYATGWFCAPKRVLPPAEELGLHPKDAPSKPSPSPGRGLGTRGAAGDGLGGTKGAGHAPGVLLGQVGASLQAGDHVCKAGTPRGEGLRGNPPGTRSTPSPSQILLLL